MRTYIPTKPSRKPRQSRPRRKVQRSDDGWSTVTSSRKAPLAISQQPLKPADIPTGTTLETLTVEYARLKEVWEASPCCAELATLLQRDLRVPESADAKKKAVENVVIVGLGSLTSMGWKRRVSMFQLAGLETFIKTLRDVQVLRKGSAVYAQDPVFNELDMQFLAGKGIEVLPTPAGFLKIEEKSLVYAPHCERSVLLPWLDGKEMSLLVCNDLGLVVEGSRRSEEVAEEKVAKELFGRGNGERWPDFEEETRAFNDLRVYIFSEDGKQDVGD